MLETFNDGMLKSAVQELTTKVVKLAKKITGLERTALPSPENTDIGKSVIVGPNKSYALVGPFGAVPDPKTSDRGKTVKVKSNKNEYELVAVPSIPTPAVADEGKVIGVDNTGAYALVSGGESGNIPVVEYCNIGQNRYGVKLNNLTDLENTSVIKMMNAEGMYKFISITGYMLLPNTNMSTLGTVHKYSDDGTPTAVTGIKNVILLASATFDANGVYPSNSILTEHTGEEGDGYLLDTDTYEFYYVTGMDNN